jgi:uncharacterized membrane protein (UPF0136 family)
LLAVFGGFAGAPVTGSLVAALLGGFAGSLLTAALTLWLEHRRQRRALRVAARLVAGELRTIESRLHITVASGTWRELHAHALTHAEWDEHRSAFAAHLPLERWSDLHTAYRLAESISRAARARREDDRLTQLEREEIETAARAAGATATELELDWTADKDRGGHPLARAHRIRLRHP